MEKHYRKMVADVDMRVARRLQEQITDENSPRCGGFPEENGIVHAKVSIYVVTTMLTAYFCEDSTYYGDQSVRDSMLLGLKFIRRVRHDNGLFDDVTCNFYSAPDTAFCVKRMLPCYRYLKQYEGELKNTADQLLPIFEELIHDGARGMLEGGFHTPNHRWAIASVLMACSRLFDDPGMQKGAERYLLEGIDCNEDGEYSEKSAGNYNRINNDAMILLSEETGDPSYEEYAIRNLRMMLTYWEPDDSIFTANSTRFDKDLLVYPKDYYMEYLTLGIRHNIPEFLDMANKIFEIVEEKGILSPDQLIYLMLHPNLRVFEHEGTYHQEDFTKYYEQSGILRCRKGRYTCTVLGGKSEFLYFHNGTIKLVMKLAGSFFEHRAFHAEKMELLPDKTMHLSQVMHGWYYLPFEEKPSTSNWWEMDNASRKKKSGPDMQIDVWITPAEGGLDVCVKTSGADGAPWRIELAFTGITHISGEETKMPVKGGEVLVPHKGTLRCSNETDALLVGPCFGEHRFIEGKEDSELRSPGAVTVYLTDYTPFDHTIRIREGDTGFEP